MTEPRIPKPQRGMIIGYAVALVFVVTLVAIFYTRVQQPAVDAKPVRPPLATQG
jgi:hypothetical protein